MTEFHFQRRLDICRLITSYYVSYTRTRINTQRINSMSRSFVFNFFCILSSLPALPSPLSPYLPLPSLPLEVAPLNPARGSGERCKLPQWSLGQSPSRNQIRCILALKCDIWWQQFWNNWCNAGPISGAETHIDCWMWSAAQIYERTQPVERDTATASVLTTVRWWCCCMCEWVLGDVIVCWFHVCTSCAEHCWWLVWCGLSV